MPVFQVYVKWGNQKYNIKCNTDKTPLDFKKELANRTSVAAERQKVLIKGINLKDDSWENVKLKDGITFMMIGSVEDLPEPPKEKAVFAEDLTEKELAKAENIPPGLVNLGNTCYMNATLQCLRAIPELKERLKGLSANPNPANRPNRLQLTQAMGELFKLMDLQSSTTTRPEIFHNVLRSTFPRFNEKEQGVFTQQDANECWTELVRVLQQNLDDGSSKEGEGEDAATKPALKLIDMYMGGEFQVVMKPEEGKEDEILKSEKFYQLSCFIEKEIRNLEAGLASGLEENITKFSQDLGRDAKYTKSSKINRLPGYLSIQFVRFFFKEKESINAKILKDVKFPFNLDVYTLCTKELRQKLIVAREKYQPPDRKAENSSKDKSKKGDDKQEVEVEEEEEEKVDQNAESYSFSDDKGSNNSGFYELKAVLTHKGRSSASGHYVAWIRKEADSWLMFDDDDVRVVSSENIMKLSGGGDWHCAYVLLYGPRPFKQKKN